MNTPYVLKNKLVKPNRNITLSLSTFPSITCILWICSDLVRTICAKLLSFFGGAEFASCITVIIIYTPLLLYIVMCKRLPWKKFNVVFLLSAGYFLFTLIIHRDYAQWYFRSHYGVIQLIFSPDKGAIWAFLMIEVSGSAEKIWNNLRYSVLGIGIYNIYLFLQARSLGYWEYMNSSGVISKRSYSLEFGYNMVFIFLVAFVSAYLYSKKIYQWVCVVALCLTLYAGSRGALICICVFLLCHFLFKQGKLIYKIVAGIGIILAGSSLYLFKNEIIILLSSMLNKFNIQSRTIEMMISGESLDDSGRSKIYNLIWDAIKDNPILGYGAFGDRKFIAPKYNWGYSHSILYEMMADFGIPLGILLLLVLIMWTLWSIAKSKNTIMAYLIIILFSMCTRLAISDTFWGDSYFWMLISLLLLNIKERRRRRI